MTTFNPPLADVRLGEQEVVRWKSVDGWEIEGILVKPVGYQLGGGSYGGYTSAWAATFASHRFKAAVVWMGITNWYSMTGTSDIFWENSTVHWNAIMYENLALYCKTQGSDLML